MNGEVQEELDWQFFPLSEQMCTEEPDVDVFTPWQDSSEVGHSFLSFVVSLPN